MKTRRSWASKRIDSVKGRAVHTTKAFSTGDLVLEYHGDLITRALGDQKHEDYKANAQIGSYMLWFKFKEKNYCIDATEETKRLGRLINHSIEAASLKPKALDVDGHLGVFFYATKQIDCGQELLWDYGERNPEVVKQNSFLVKKKKRKGNPDKSRLNADGSAPGTMGMPRSSSSAGPSGSSGVGATLLFSCCII